jgi:hypothetical protein
MPRKKGVPYARSDQLKERHTFSLTRKAYDGIKRFAAQLGLSMSAILEGLGRGELFITRIPPTFKDLMLAWDLEELAELAGIPIERLQEISEGKGDRIQPHELIGLESATGVAYEKLDQLANKGEHQSNGC